MSNQQVVYSHLRCPVDAHDEDKLKKELKIAHMTFPKHAWLPDPTSKIENHQAVEDRIDTQENEDDDMEVEKLREILSKHAGNTNTGQTFRINTI